MTSIEKARKRPAFALNDTGNAERFAAQHRDAARYVAPQRQWYTWDGTRWLRDARGAVDLLAKDTARSIDDEVAHEQDDDRRKQLRAHATKTQSRAGRENMIALARAELSAEPTDFDRDPWALNVTNGTINLRTGELRAHRREDMITKLAPVVFDPDATSPLWDAFLRRGMAGNEDLIGYLQRFAGYALTGMTSEHVLAFSYGDGDNGKGVFHNTLSRVLGDYASKAPRGLLYETKGDRHPTELADLHGARFVLCPEVKRGQRFDEALVKDLVGEDVIRARRMHQDFWSFEPTHKLFICGNHKPVVSGTDHGIWRRIRLIPWTVTIPPHEKDRNLLGKLQTEASGILTWAVLGCLEWQAFGLGEPSDVDRATAAYRQESDPLHDFYQARCVFDADAKVARRVIRVEYEAWCRDIGAEPIGARRFAESLTARGVRDGGTVSDPRFATPQDAWRGVRLRTDAERG